MSEFNDWMDEVRDTQLVDGRWVRPGRRPFPALAVGVFAAGLLILALAAAARAFHGA